VSVTRGVGGAVANERGLRGGLSSKGREREAAGCVQGLRAAQRSATGNKSSLTQIKVGAHCAAGHQRGCYFFGDSWCVCHKCTLHPIKSCHVNKLNRHHSAGSVCVAAKAPETLIILRLNPTSLDAPSVGSDGEPSSRTPPAIMVALFVMHLSICAMYWALYLSAMTPHMKSWRTLSLRSSESLIDAAGK